MATVILHRILAERGFVRGQDFAMVAHIHDEMQIEVPNKGDRRRMSATPHKKQWPKPATHYRFRLPIDWRIQDRLVLERDALRLTIVEVLDKARKRPFSAKSTSPATTPSRSPSAPARATSPSAKPRACTPASGSSRPPVRITSTA